MPRASTIAGSCCAAWFAPRGASCPARQVAGNCKSALEKRGQVAFARDRARVLANLEGICHSCLYTSPVPNDKRGPRGKSSNRPANIRPSALPSNMLQLRRPPPTLASCRRPTLSTAQNPQTCRVPTGARRRRGRLRLPRKSSRAGRYGH